MPRTAKKLDKVSRRYLDSLLEYVRHTRAWVERMGPSPLRMAAVSIMHCYLEMAEAYVLAVRQKTRNHARVHYAIEKVAAHWAYIAPMVEVATMQQAWVSASAEENKNLPANIQQLPAVIELLPWVIEAAYHSLKLSEDSQPVEPPERIALHLSRNFEMTQFHYAPRLMLLGLPVYVLQTPWEWTVVWHELAGRLVKQEEIVALIKESISGSNALWRDLWDAWKEPFRLKEDAVDPKGWLEEFIEDACSTLVFGPLAYRVLYEMLNRHYLSMSKATRVDGGEHVDARHPTPYLRLAVTYELLVLMAEHMAEDNTRAQSLLSDIKKKYTWDDRDAVQGACRQLADWLWSHSESFVESAMLYQEWSDEDVALIPKQQARPRGAAVERDTPLLRAWDEVKRQSEKKGAVEPQALRKLAWALIRPGSKLFKGGDVKTMADEIVAFYSSGQQQWPDLTEEAVQVQPFIIELEAHTLTELQNRLLSDVDLLTATLLTRDGTETRDGNDTHLEHHDTFQSYQLSLGGFPSEHGRHEGLA